MSFTKYKTVYKTRKDHECFSCGRTIFKATMCTYGVTTDPDAMRYRDKITTGYFCTVCRDVNLN